MPYFALHGWDGYLLRLVPRDRTRNAARACLFRRDVVPYFYGPVSFDLAVTSPNAKVKAGEVIEYEWKLLASNDGKQLKMGFGCVPFAYTNPFVIERAKAGEATHYSNTPRGYRIIRKIQAVDLGHMSSLEQYRIDMRFRGRVGAFTEYTTMLEFTLKDRDDFYQNVWLLFIGAVIGAAFTIVGGIIGYILWGG